jgi:WD40 repeat protein
LQYNAFISYSHAGDGQLAPALQSALQRFAKPWYRLRALRIFRDTTSLAATPSLWGSIEQALERSEHFLLLASPEAAGSFWINQEVTWWLQNRSPSTMLIVLTGGRLLWDQPRRDFDRDVTTALPPALLGRLLEEPLYVDLCWARNEEHLSLRNTRFRSAILDLAATLHGRPKDELDGDDVRQHRRTVRIARTAAGVLAMLTAAAITAAVIAIDQQGIARSRELAANARTALAIDPELSLILAKAAVETKRTEQADSALQEALQRSNVRLVQRGHSREVTNALFVGDDAVSVGFDKVLVWDAKTGAVKRQHPGHRMAICDTMIAIADGTRAALWSLSDGTERASLPGHATIIDDLAISPDCQWVATASRDRTARIYDTATGQPAGPAIEASDTLSNVRFSPDSRWLVTIRTYNRTDIWEVPTGRPVLSTPGHAVSFSPDSNLLVAGGADNTGMRIWKPGDQQLIETTYAQPGSINSVQFSPDGSLFVTAGTDQTARIWDARKLRPVAVLSGHTDDVVAASFSHDGRLIATASHDQTARVWVARTGKLVAELRGHSDTVNAAVFARDDKRVLTASADGTARIWEVGMTSPILALAESGEADASEDPAFIRILESASPTGLVRGLRTVHQVAFSHDGRLILLATDTGTTEVWELATRQQRATVSGTIAAFSPDGALFATGTEDGTVNVFRTADGQSVGSREAHKDLVSGLRFSADGRFVASASEDGTAQVFAVATGERVALLEGHAEALSGIWFSPNGSRALTASFDHTAAIWRLPDGTREHSLQHDESIWAADFSRDSSRVATADFSGVARIWEASSGKLLTELKGHKGGIVDIHFDASGERVLTAGSDGTARIWTAGREVMVLGAHTRGLYRAVWSPDERFVATASQDGAARLWDAASGRLIATFGDHENAVYDVAFSPDGAYLMSGSEDGAAHLYACDVCAPIDTLLELAQKRITRPPTDLEAEAYGLAR